MSITEIEEVIAREEEKAVKLREALQLTESLIKKYKALKGLEIEVLR
jgi:hypothetical protein